VVRRLTALLVLAAITASAQPPARHVTNIGALIGFPGFFHLRPILVVGTVATTDKGIHVSDEAGNSIRVIPKGSAIDGLDEIRGEFWDIGRMKPDEPQLAGYDIKRTFDFDPDGPWPRPGEVTAIIATAVTATRVPSATTIRTLALFPSRFVGQKVTVSGQYGGRNLFGDLPDAPGRNRFDFVVRLTGSAIWVSGAQPKGKGFNFSLDSRLDTGRWLEVTGTVREGRGLQWLETTSEGLKLGTPITEAPADEPIRVAMGPPPEVLFSLPSQDEIDVSQSTTVRIQFSRDLDPATLKGSVKAHYLESQTVERGEPTTPTIEFTTAYRAPNRTLEIRFSKPLERFRTVLIELSDQILGTDKQALRSWTLRFDTGGA
jgi:Bacterial Ig-like domain